MKLRRGELLAISSGIVLLIWAGNRDADQRAAERAAPPPAAAQPATLPAGTIAECNAFLAQGARIGLIMARPTPTRIDVDEDLWARLDYPTKQRLLQALSCATFARALPPPGASAVAYGRHTGKRLAILTATGYSAD